MTDSLSSICGPHCGSKDGFTGHCHDCHDIKGEAALKMAAHENVNREREQWSRDGANGRASASEASRENG